MGSIHPQPIPMGWVMNVFHSSSTHTNELSYEWYTHRNVYDSSLRLQSTFCQLWCHTNSVISIISISVWILWLELKSHNQSFNFGECDDVDITDESSSWWWHNSCQHNSTRVKQIFKTGCEMNQQQVTSNWKIFDFNSQLDT